MTPPPDCRCTASLPAWVRPRTWGTKYICWSHYCKEWRLCLCDPECFYWLHDFFSDMHSYFLGWRYCVLLFLWPVKVDQATSFGKFMHVKTCITFFFSGWFKYHLTIHLCIMDDTIILIIFWAKLVFLYWAVFHCITFSSITWAHICDILFYLF